MKQNQNVQLTSIKMLLYYQKKHLAKVDNNSQLKQLNVQFYLAISY